MSLTYELRHGSYYLVDLAEAPSRLTGERSILLMTDEVAIAFDRDTGTMLKHGNPERVDAWVKERRAAYRASGFDEQAEAMVVISGAFPLEELNACLGNASYVQVLFDKLQKGLLTSAKQPAQDVAETVPSATPTPAVKQAPTIAATTSPTPAPVRSMFPGRR